MQKILNEDRMTQEPRPDAAHTASTQSNMICVEGLTGENRRVCMREISEIVVVNAGFVHSIVHHLGYSKMC